ncbi:MAG: hypothetical protein LCH61_10625 [Proteobacteria bacterium]|nr:hypothetical protein [Pseudomonadota bacterium]
MSHPTFVNCAFDPKLCPLLHGLTPEEQKLRMETDPLIRACVQSVVGGGTVPSQCAAATTTGSPKKTARGKIKAEA